MAYVKNDFPMRDWHFEHMKKMIAKYVRGIPEDATGWEKKYGKRFTCTFARKQIEYDIKHGVSLEETLSAFQAIRSKPEYAI